MKPKLTLEELADQNRDKVPGADAAAMAMLAEDHKKREEELTQAAEIKKQIVLMLEQGKSSDAILKAAIKAIGIYSSDNYWFEQCDNILTRLYPNAVNSLHYESREALIEDRLKDARERYHGKLRKQVRSSIKKCEELQNEYFKIEALINQFDAEADDLF